MALLTESATVKLRRPNIAIGVLGQSNERGNVATTDMAAYPQAFQSLRNPAGMRVPIGPATAAAGGWWPKVYDDLWDWGYDLQIVNGGIGSMSFVKHGAGQMQYNNRSNGYSRKRASAGFPDRGYVGDVICPNGNRVFRCTTGRDIAAMNKSPFPSIGSTAVNLDYIQNMGAQSSASAAPDFTTANVGDTVTDGGIVWTCESLTVGAYGGSGGTIFTEGQNGLGFDPLGILARLDEDMQRTRNVKRKIVYICNGQSDTSSTQAWYQAALIAQANFFLNRGYDVMIGLTSFSPGSGSTAQYDTLAAAVSGAMTALQAGTFGSRVFAGANLYALMGSTGNMASGGAYLQSDGIHLNGQSAIVAGGYVAASFKAILPQLLTL